MGLPASTWILPERSVNIFVAASIVWSIPDAMLRAKVLVDVIAASYQEGYPFDSGILVLGTLIVYSLPGCSTSML